MLNVFNYHRGTRHKFIFDGSGRSWRKRRESSTPTWVSVSPRDRGPEWEAWRRLWAWRTFQLERWRQMQLLSRASLESSRGALGQETRDPRSDAVSEAGSEVLGGPSVLWTVWFLPFLGLRTKFEDQTIIRNRSREICSIKSQRVNILGFTGQEGTSGI